GTAHLDRVGVRGTDAKMLGEHSREHDVRRDRRIAAKDAVDVGALQPGVSGRKLGRLAHEIERGEAFMLAVGGKADAGDVGHSRAPSFLPSFRGARSANPESRGSTMRNRALGFDAFASPGND